MNGARVEILFDCPAELKRAVVFFRSANALLFVSFNFLIKLNFSLQKLNSFD